ncbi:MAG: hypothetical protein H6672_06795 [Anaerolineaceae bacterium]|nr:hypothetical protein [Anaerolineaceae bacterium]
MRRWIGIMALLVFAFAQGAIAQSGGQLCVRAFEDRNGNGILDAGEPLLTRGVAMSLMDASGVTVATGLMDTSSTASQGVVCFQGLASGQYTVAVTSADFTATTPDLITTTVAEDGLPTVIEYGGRLPTAATTTTATTSTPAQPTLSDEVLRWALASAGALIVVVGMGILGTFIYLFFFRNRPRSIPAATDVSRTTGSMRAVRSRDTSEHPRVE